MLRFRNHLLETAEDSVFYHPESTNDNRDNSSYRRRTADVRNAVHRTTPQKQEKEREREREREKRTEGRTEQQKGRIDRKGRWTLVNAGAYQLRQRLNTKGHRDKRAWVVSLLNWVVSTSSSLVVSSCTLSLLVFHDDVDRDRGKRKNEKRVLATSKLSSANAKMQESRFPRVPVESACHYVFRIRPIEPRNSVNGHERALTSASIPCRSIRRRINANVEIDERSDSCYCGLY